MLQWRSHAAARWSTSALLPSAAEQRVTNHAERGVTDAWPRQMPLRSRAAGRRYLGGVVFVLTVVLALTQIKHFRTSFSMLSLLQPAAKPLTVCLFTNREAPALAVINTVFQHAATPEAIGAFTLHFACERPFVCLH